MSQLIQYCKCDLKYKQLSPIDTCLLTQIQSVFIYTDSSGAGVFIVTKTDEVYAFGTNKNGRLGLGHNFEVKEPTIISELWGKGVKDIQCGHKFTVALTESGHIYVFGREFNGLTEEAAYKFNKPLIVTTIDNLVTDIKCANYNYVLLTATGQLFWFGHRSYDYRIGVNTPTKINGFDENEIISISCGYDHTLALTLSGKVFSWGYNFYGQLGLGHRSNSETPEMISFDENVFVKQISCGQNHSLVLTSDGDVFAFGYNNAGQLGAGDLNRKQTTPLLIDDHKFKEIQTHGNISLGLDLNSKIYVWGSVKERRVTSPELTEFSSFQEVIKNSSQYMSTLTPITYEDLFYTKRIKRLAKTMTKAFNNPVYSDIKFKVRRKGSEEQFDYIYGHKWFIAENSEHFQTMFSNNWSETETNVIVVNGYSYEAYYQFIRCLYTDYIELVDIQVLIELLSISEEYFDDDIKDKCVQQIKLLVTDQNVCSVYALSIKFRAKSLEEFCFRRISINIKDIVKTEDYTNMDPIYSKQFFTEFYCK